MLYLFLNPLDSLIIITLILMINDELKIVLINLLFNLHIFLFHYPFKIHQVRIQVLNILLNMLFSLNQGVLLINNKILDK